MRTRSYRRRLRCNRSAAAFSAAALIGIVILSESAVADERRISLELVVAGRFLLNSELCDLRREI